MNLMNKYEIIQDMDQAITVLHSVAIWLEKSGKNPSKWWQPKNMNREFFLQHAEPSEFYVVLVEGAPAAAAILQNTERNQSWKSIDKDKKVTALYIHWLCVSREFAGTGLPNIIINFAAQKALSCNIHVLRLDADAKEKKLTEIYEKLGFYLVTIEQDSHGETAFYQKTC